MNDFYKEPENGTQPLTPDTQEQTAAPAPVEFSAEPMPEAAPAGSVFAEPAPETDPGEPVSAEPAPTQPAPETVPAEAPAAVPYPPANDGPTAVYYAPAAPQGGNAQPMPAPYPQKKKREKRKMPLGLRLLIITMCVLFGVSFFGLIGYGVYTAATSTSDFLSDYTDYPGFEDEFGFLEDWTDGEETTPAEDEETEENEITIPDIEVMPNKDGLMLNEIPTDYNPEITEIYDKVIRSTVLVNAVSEFSGGTGTGIIATEDGYIITNSHVVLNTRNVEVEVKTSDGVSHEAVVVGFDKTTDLAVLKIEGSGYTPAEFGNSGYLHMGQWVLAIGNPGGEQFSGSITRGIVSGLGRSVGAFSANGMTYIQTDAAINPGNSGGPLVNMYGQVIGINSSKIAAEEFEGMGFAIPITGAKTIVDDLLAGGYVEGRVRFGIKGSEINAMQSAMSDVPQGFLILEIDEDSSFAGTDVQPYDIIISIEGQETPTLNALSNVLLGYAPGDTVTVQMFRPRETGPGGEEFEVTIVLLEDKGETQN